MTSRGMAVVSATLAAAERRVHQDERRAAFGRQKVVDQLAIVRGQRGAGICLGKARTGSGIQLAYPECAAGPRRRQRVAGRWSMASASCGDSAGRGYASARLERRQESISLSQSATPARAAGQA